MLKLFSERLLKTYSDKFGANRKVMICAKKLGECETSLLLFLLLRLLYAEHIFISKNLALRSALFIRTNHLTAM